MHAGISVQYCAEQFCGQGRLEAYQALGQHESSGRFFPRGLLQAMSRLTTTQALAINVLSVPLSLWISGPPSTTVTVPFP
jgi:hypothetical protein